MAQKNKQNGVETLHMRVSSQIGELLLEIAQTEISKGNVEFGLSRYTTGLQGFTKEYALMCLKNEAVLVADSDGCSVNLTDAPECIEANAKNIFDWKTIINNRIKNLKDTLEGVRNTESKFNSYTITRVNDIRNYNMYEMIKEYYDTEEMNSGIVNIAARICGHPECKITDHGTSNPQSIWEKFKYKCEDCLYEESKISLLPSEEWKIPLYLTVCYNELIRILHKEYLSFATTYTFLVDNGFIERPSFIEELVEWVVSELMEFCSPNKRYYHPLCDEGLAKYKESLHDDILKTRFGKEYCRNGIIQKNIMDGYDAGWLSPDGEFYGGNGDTSSFVHLSLAEKIYNGGSIYANRMANEGVSVFGGINSPEYWLEKHGWVKVSHQDCYGSFLGTHNEKPTPDFPYSYIPTEIQVKMICDYADKFYGGKFYTEAGTIFGRSFHSEPYSTRAIRQMDDIALHAAFRP